MRLLIAICFVLLIGVPLVFRPTAHQDQGQGTQLIIVTPHNEQIRYEFKRAFEAWHLRTFGEPVNVVYNVPGGTSEIRRLLESQYRSALEEGRTPGGEADLMFGGGSYEHGELKKPIVVAGGSRRVSVSAPVDFDQAWLDSVYGPNEIGAGKLYDPDRHWFGAALSGFGIIYNRDVLAQLGVSEPRDWTDLCDPRLQGWVALVNPGQSGSVKTTFESILHRDGWQEGWRLIRRMAANARYVSASSLKPPIDVTHGNAAMGVAIDFYGRFQSQAMKEAGDAGRIGYADPQGGGSIDADPISLLTNAPHPQLARRFIEFALSDEGQALWQFPRRESGSHELGPARFELRRMPIVRGMYERHAGQFIDPVDPFITAIKPEHADSAVRDFISPMFSAMVMDNHHQLRRAWWAIWSHPASAGLDPLAKAAEVHDPRLRAMLAAFDRMPGLPDGNGNAISLDDAESRAELRMGWVKGQWKALGLWDIRESGADAMRRRFAAFFDQQFERVIDLAEGRADPNEG